MDVKKSNKLLKLIANTTTCGLRDSDGMLNKIAIKNHMPSMFMKAWNRKDMPNIKTCEMI